MPASSCEQFHSVPRVILPVLPLDPALVPQHDCPGVNIHPVLRVHICGFDMAEGSYPHESSLVTVLGPCTSMPRPVMHSLVQLHARGVVPYFVVGALMMVGLQVASDSVHLLPMQWSMARVELYDVVIRAQG